MTKNRIASHAPSPPGQTDGDGGTEIVKKSIVLTDQLWKKADAVCHDKGVTLSHLIRQLLGLYLDDFAGKEKSATSAKISSHGLRTPALAALVDILAQRLGLGPESLIEQIVADHLQEYVETAANREAQIQALKDKLVNGSENQS